MDFFHDALDQLPRRGLIKLQIRTEIQKCLVDAVDMEVVFADEIELIEMTSADFFKIQVHARGRKYVIIARRQFIDAAARGHAWAFKKGETDKTMVPLPRDFRPRSVA
jgi:hypothetical protein